MEIGLLAPVHWTSAYPGTGPSSAYAATIPFIKSIEVHGNGFVGFNAVAVVVKGPIEAGTAVLAQLSVPGREGSLSVYPSQPHPGCPSSSGSSSHSQLLNGVIGILGEGCPLGGVVIGGVVDGERLEGDALAISDAGRGESSFFAGTED